MSEVASRKLCQELYELSGWIDTEKGYVKWASDSDWKLQELARGKTVSKWAPAYDLGYLLIKLPKHLKLQVFDEDLDCRFELVPQGYSSGGATLWCAGYVSAKRDIPMLEAMKEPTNAVCQLAIALFKQGVLQHV